MKKNLKNILKDFNEFFENDPNTQLQSWSLLNDFYHLLLTYMEKNDISRTQLAEKLGVSRSAISQLFNVQPNISLKKIAKISNAIGLRIKLTSDQIEQPQIEKRIIIKLAPSIVYNSNLENDIQKEDKDNKPQKIYNTDYEIHYQVAKNYGQK